MKRDQKESRNDLALVLDDLNIEAVAVEGVKQENLLQLSHCSVHWARIWHEWVDERRGELWIDFLEFFVPDPRIEDSFWSFDYVSYVRPGVDLYAKRSYSLLTPFSRTMETGWKAKKSENQHEQKLSIFIADFLNNDVGVKAALNKVSEDKVNYAISSYVDRYIGSDELGVAIDPDKRVEVTDGWIIVSYIDAISLTRPVWDLFIAVAEALLKMPLEINSSPIYLRSETKRELGESTQQYVSKHESSDRGVDQKQATDKDNSRETDSLKYLIWVIDAIILIPALIWANDADNIWINLIAVLIVFIIHMTLVFLRFGRKS